MVKTTKTKKSTKKSKQHALLKPQSFRFGTLAVLVVAIAAVGTYLIKGSHAVSPYTFSVAAINGSSNGSWYKDSATIVLNYNTKCFYPTVDTTDIPITLAGQHTYYLWSDADGDPYMSVDSGGTSTIASVRYCTNDTNRIEEWNAPINIDNTAPTVEIDAPAATQSSQTTITGNASDPGVGSSGVASITVNGVGANLTNVGSNNYTYSATVPINVGVNTITAVATDLVGHTASAQSSVTRTVPPPPPPSPTPNPSPGPSPNPTSKSSPAPPSSKPGSSSSGKSNQSSTATTAPIAATPVESNSTSDTGIDFSAPSFGITTSVNDQFTITSADKKISVTIPARTLTSDTRCIIAPTTADSPPHAATKIFSTYNLTCSNSSGVPVINFINKATVTMIVPHSSNPLTSYKYFAYAQNASGWNNPPSRYSSKNHTIIFNISSPTVLLASRTSKSSTFANGLTVVLGLGIVAGVAVTVLRVRRYLLS